MSQQDFGEDRNPPVPNSPLRRSLRLRNISPASPADLHNRSRIVKRKLETTIKSNHTERTIDSFNEETRICQSYTGNFNDNLIGIVEKAEAGNKLQSIKESDEVNEVDNVKTKMISNKKTIPDASITLEISDTKSSCASPKYENHVDLEKRQHLANENQIASSHIKKKYIAMYHLNNAIETTTVEQKMQHIDEEEIANSNQTSLNEGKDDFTDSKEITIDLPAETSNQNTFSKNSFEERILSKTTDEKNQCGENLNVETSVFENKNDIYISQYYKDDSRSMNIITSMTQEDKEKNNKEEWHVALGYEHASNKTTSNIGRNGCETKNDTSKKIKNDIVTTEKDIPNKLQGDEVSPTIIAGKYKKNHFHSVTKENIIKLDSKIDELLDNSSNLSSNESGVEHNSFLDDMAEEGEEDTPSEQSNDIIEVGEIINTTESELSSDHSYDKNSFIDDEEDYQLLSGEEYDLSFDNNNKKRKRIIELNSGSDEDIIKIAEPKKKNTKKLKKSRIIKFSDTSDEEIFREEMTFARTDNRESDVNDPQDPVVNIKDDILQDLPLESVKESTCFIEPNLETCSIKKNRNENILIIGSETELDDGYVPKNEKPNKNDSLEEITFTAQSSNKDVAIKQESICKKVLILENTKVEDICNKNLSSEINNVIKSIFSGIAESSEVSINLSMDCSFETLEPNFPKDDQYEQTRVQSETDEEHHCRQEIADGKNDDQCSIKVLYPIDSKSLSRKKNKEREETGKTNNSSHKRRSFETKPLFSVPTLVNVENNRDIKYISSRIESIKHSYSVNYAPVDKGCENLKSKRRKRHRKKSFYAKEPTNENTKLSLLQEAVKVNKHNTLFPLPLNNLLANKWEVERISIKPTSEVDYANHQKPRKSYKSTGTFGSKFHGKDFKNLMLYDNNRVRRAGTKQHVKKKVDLIS